MRIKTILLSSLLILLLGTLFLFSSPQKADACSSWCSACHTRSYYYGTYCNFGPSSYTDGTCSSLCSTPTPIPTGGGTPTPTPTPGGTPTPTPTPVSNCSQCVSSACTNYYTPSCGTDCTLCPGSTPTPTPGGTPTPTPGPTYTVSGNVFVDTNKDKKLDNGETNYAGGITITSTTGTVIYPTTGAFTITALPAGNYIISYTSLPTGYQLTFPINGPPPSLTVSVGTGNCSVGNSNSAICDSPASGDIASLNFGITNSLPWIQSVGGGNVGGDGGINAGGGGGTSGIFNDPIPSTALLICGGPYASIPGNTSTTPGLIFTGVGNAYFGQGSASLNNWVVGGTNYPESFGPIAQGGFVKTSYTYLQSIAKQAGITPTDILPYCGLIGLSGCNLNFSTLPHGIYVATGDLTLTDNGTPPSYTFPSNQSYIILVHGNLTIQTQLHLPVGSTALFSASGNITVDRLVGETGALGYQSSNPDIEGVFSADQNFIIDGQNDCTIGPDLKLNVAGSIITNAALNGGTFLNQRDLCENDIYCPVFTVQSRPDFILNAPNFIKKTNYTWQEVAP